MKEAFAVILGGGRGSRLFPLTKYRAKPAVPVAGKFRLIDIPLSNCIHSTINRIFVMTQFSSASLHGHISQAFVFDHFRRGFIQLLAAEQSMENEGWYQGTADAVRKNLIRLVNTEGDMVLILAGDHLYRMDYRKMMAMHRVAGADITIAAIPVDREETPELGILRTDDKGRIIQFAEKPQTDEELNGLALSPRMLKSSGMDPDAEKYSASMGIYVFEKKVLVQLLNECSDPDFGKHIIPGAIDRFNVHAHLFKGYWRDIGTIKAFFDTNLELTDPDPEFSFYEEDRPIFTRARFLPGAKIKKCRIRHSLISDGSVISGAEVTRSIIGIRSKISDDAQLREVIMMGADHFENNPPKDKPPVGIGERSVLRRAIIDKNARIGRDVQILNPTGLDDFDGQDYCIKNGIVIIPKNAVIPDGSVI